MNTLIRLTLMIFVLSGTSACADEEIIIFNQAGFHPDGSKIAVVRDSGSNSAQLIGSNGQVVYSAQLSDSSPWVHSNEEVRIFDFTDVNDIGVYLVRLDNGAESGLVQIYDNPMADAGYLALRSFYLIRSGTELTPELAGKWARAAGHPDTEVYIHESAAGPKREAGDIISSPGGWYDAGDYNKYIVNSAFTVYFMLRAYEACPECFPDGASRIPESGNGQSDLLDEIRFNLDWMLTMQDPDDGGVYHKLTTKKFGGMVMPKDNKARRYVVQKSTAAALDLAAVSAYAARLFRPVNTAYADQLIDVAVRAWQWAVENPAIPYKQPEDISTGTYARGQDTFKDEWGWARVELYLTTGKPEFLDGWDVSEVAGGPPDWSYVMPLGWLSLLNNGGASPELASVAKEHIMKAADILANAAQTGYRVSIGAYDRNNTEGQSDPDWVWGSNGVAAVQAVILDQAWRITGDRRYLDAAVGNFDYLMGRNPNAISYLSGAGERHSMNLHSRPSVADDVEGSVPGLLAGGPHNGYQDKKDCKSADYVHPDAPAKSYYDMVCSFATNENAINWNGAMVAASYLLHQSLEALQD